MNPKPANSLINLQKDDNQSQVESMFDAISPRYDRLNRILSFRSDVRWRRKAVKMLNINPESRILDLACGTGDLTLALSKLKPQHIEAVDVSSGMLALAKIKFEKHNLHKQISITKAAAEDLPFNDQSFDIVTIAFGVRNFSDLHKGINEIHRVLKPGGQLLILEFGLPQNKIFGCVYKWYFIKILPFVGRLISGSKMAYHYLPNTVQKFPYGRDFEKIISNQGFDVCRSQKLSFGVAYNYLFQK